MKYIVGKPQLITLRLHIVGNPQLITLRLHIVGNPQLIMLRLHIVDKQQRRRVIEVWSAVVYPVTMK